MLFQTIYKIPFRTIYKKPFKSFEFPFRLVKSEHITILSIRTDFASHFKFRFLKILRTTSCGFTLPLQTATDC